MNQCVDISSWKVIHAQTKGSRNKKWVVKPSASEKSEIELFLFKESHSRHPVEFWSEVIAHKVGELVNISTPETFCAKFENTYGALIRFFLKIKDRKIVEELRHGGDLILAKHPDFDRRKGESHNIYFVEEVLVKNLGRDHLFKEFLKLLVFDAIIGNTDRHQDNWGLIVPSDKTKNEIKLTPAFDNSDSLGRELVDEKLGSFLEEGELKLRRYIERGSPHLRWSDDGINLEWINHFELLKRLAEKWPAIADNVKEQTSFTDETIRNILKPFSGFNIDIPKYVLTSNRVKLIERIICIRRDLLRERFEI
ncbi:MAG: HipA domain-containing protein [Candidatus Omnitrophota bacterium]